MKWFKFCNHDNDFIHLTDDFNEFRKIMMNTKIQNQINMANAYFSYIESSPFLKGMHAPYEDNKMLHPIKFALNYLRDKDEKDYEK